MEEILASIRKIIESNEPGAGKSISSSLPPVYELSDEDVEDIRLTIDDDLAAAEFNDIPPAPAVSPDPRFVAANSAGQQRETAPEGRSLSLADVAARVRAASERNSVQTGASREGPQPRELPPEMAARLAEVRFSHEESQPRAAVVDAPVAPPAAAQHIVHESAPAKADVREAEAPFVDNDDVVAAMADVVVPIRTVEEPTQVQPQPAAPQPAAPQPAAFMEREQAPAQAPLSPAFAEAPRPQPQPLPITPQPAARFLPQVQDEVQRMLVSEATGEQVARSFDDLAAALGQERRSLDEIAQDMLRPMLQEWLDDNLPTLVERLVREEIERVARGPRR
jgi:cell pole-organizing protein PopZ